ncbi:NAD(P)-binding domain-containing protein [Micromonospora sp. ATA51]|uniref:NAD(P)-dependent oxidoreductase n=1 Tax=Micromonospora sp. ATA51 TaxID=2806098 RepID=UPI001A5944C4|nr:NAD(P)-binding domain-containing protein [Micromonospora sp. ATA51]MBM0224586.1 NAD(P)-dependent oxidoreductase [Micromonospora sp. ATA51]
MGAPPGVHGCAGRSGACASHHTTIADLASACDMVALAVPTDEDVLQIVSHDLLDGMRPGSVVVNHGTGVPRNAIRLVQLCADRGVDALDAPVSGGRPGAQARTLTVLVGGAEAVAQRCEPVRRSFATHVVHAGPAGAGQMAKLFNNALLMMNQAAIADVVDLGLRAGLDPGTLVEGLKLGSATSAALTLLNTMVTPDTVEHLSRVEALDMQLFEEAMTAAGVEAAEATARGLPGANRLPDLVRQLNR